MATNGKEPIYQKIDGILFPAGFSPKCIKEAMAYKPRPDDLIIDTYPKCGTTWMQNVVLYIYRKGELVTDVKDFFSICPFIDMLGQQSIDNMTRPGSLKTHLPYTHMPYSHDAKYIFLARNPKDCLVSLYHHHRMLPVLGFWDGDFDYFFELFMKGEVEYSDYFDHLLSWYPHRNDPNVFYTTYENMKADTAGVVVKLARFIGKEYSDAVEKDNAVLQNILLYSSFEFMKKNLAVRDHYSIKDQIKKDPSVLEGFKYMVEFTESLGVPENRPKHEFVRKGIVGDWKNHMTADQVDRLNARFLEKTKGTEIQDWFPL